MRFLVLGPIQVTDRGRPLELESGRRRAILAALLLHPGRVVSPDRLIGVLWGDEPPRSARNSLYSHVSRLRDALDTGGDQRLVTRAGGYVLDLRGDDEIDAAAFEQLARKARGLVGDRPHEALEAAESALALWRGRPYGELEDIDPFRSEAVRLDEMLLTLRETRIEAYLALGRHDEVVGELQSAVAEQPLREQLVGLLMRALQGAGRRAEALEAFRDHRERMVDELGLEPSPWLTELHTRLLRGPEEVAAPSMDPLGGDQRRGGLDLPLTSFHGRDEDVAGVESLLDHARLVTLTGPGGVGKTRLALEVGRRLEDRFADGAFACLLAPVSDANAVPHVLAAALGVVPSGAASLLDTVLGALRGQEALLLLDNCEHLLPAVSRLCERLLQRCPDLRILATSRERLAVDGEHVWRVAPLAVPSIAPLAVPSIAPLAVPSIEGAETVWATPAGGLFRDRATAADPSLQFDEDDAAAVAEICCGLDGLPLAIELAAARAASMPLRGLAARLSDRFEVLGGGRGGDLDRHRTLRSLVDWSYDLLEEEEQGLFARLSVFVGSFALEAAEEVCGSDGVAAGVTGALLGLVDRSMVARRGDRYTLLETLRVYGWERLVESGGEAALRAAHAGYYLALANQASVGLRGAEEGTWVQTVRADFDNLRAAHRRAVETGDADTALGIPSALWFYAQWRAEHEVFEWAERAVAMPSAEDHPLMPTALGTVAMGASNRGNLLRAKTQARRALALADAADGSDRVLPLHVLALVALYSGRLEECLRVEAEVERLAESLSHRAEAIDARTTMATADAYLGNVERAATRARRSCDEAREVGNPTSLALALHVLGEAVRERHPEAALGYYDESLQVARPVGGRFVEGLTLGSIGAVSSRAGDPERAARSFQEVIEHWRSLGDWTHQWIALRNLAGLLARAGHEEAAAVLLGAGERNDAPVPSYGADAERLAGLAAELGERMGRDGLAAAMDHGARLAAGDTVDYALDALARLRD